MLKTESQHPGKTQHPQLLQSRTKKWYKEIFSFGHTINPFLKCDITQTMLFDIIAVLAKLLLFSYVIKSSVQIYY